MVASFRAPDHAALTEDLTRLREGGLRRLPGLRLPALGAVAHYLDEQAETAPGVELALRKAVQRLGGGDYGDAAEHLFGLSQGTRARSSAERRELAAGAINRTADTFRKRYEKDLLSEIANQVLALCAEARLRETHTQLERRHPAESRLAVQWVERFEAYNRIWTPVWALGADLTAYRSTLLETDRPYDRAAGTNGPDDRGYTQEEQAEGYARFALFRYAWFEWELRQFMIRHGGLWLLSSSEAETEVADCVYRVSWHVTPFNERDQSWLRSTIGETKGLEMDHFLRILASTSTGQETHREWQEWAASCRCVWDPGVESDEQQGHFPTRHRHPAISSDCQVHQVIQACSDYCELVDREWLKIADWYHLNATQRRSVSGEGLYREWRAGSLATSSPKRLSHLPPSD